MSLLHSVGNSISVEIVQASSVSSLQVVGNSVAVSVVQASLESTEASSLSIRSLSFERVGNSVSVEIESLRSREDSLRLETRLEASGLVHASLELIGNSVSVQIGEASDGSSTQVSHGKDSVVSVRSFNDLLVDGQSLLDQDGSVNLLVDDRLHLLNDLVDDGLVNDWSIGHSLRHGCSNLSGGEVSWSRSLSKEDRVVLDDGSSCLSRKGN